MTVTDRFLEKADIETSSEGYARRFSGKTGDWFLKIQEQATLEMLKPYPNATLLDVGGGHGQLTRPLINNQYQVTVFGSDPVCKNRIAPYVNQKLCSFDVGDILNLPYPDQAFDVVVSYRLLPHVTRWKKLLSELTRVARKAVVIDYPEVRSVNYLAPYLFQLKKRAEGNTRPFTCFRGPDLLDTFRDFGFQFGERYAEFFWPMVLHRQLKSVRLSSTAERICRALGITDLLGSPVILKVVRERS